MEYEGRIAIAARIFKTANLVIPLMNTLSSNTTCLPQEKPLSYRDLSSYIQSFFWIRHAPVPFLIALEGSQGRDGGPGFFFLKFTTRVEN